MCACVRVRKDGDHHGIEPAKLRRLLNNLEAARALASDLLGGWVGGKGGEWASFSRYRSPSVCEGVGVGVGVGV